MKIKSTLSKAGKTKRQKPKYWVVAVTTVGIFVAYSVGSSRALAVTYRDKASIVRADNRDDKRGDKRENETRAFNIPAGTLADAITAFEKTTGWRVIVPDSEIGKIASPGVFGVYTDEDALRQLLKNTSVAYDFTDLKTVTLKIQDVSATVEVVGEARSVSTPKYTEPLRDTPQTINVITSEVIEQQNATTLRDVLRNVPGLTVAAGEGGNVGGDNINLRGFSARNDIYVDGARDLSPQSRDPFSLEQVEVVKGPSSSYTGRGSTGGTINLVSKTPSLKPIYNFDLTAGSDKTKRITSDINLPLARLGLGEQTAFRLNFMAHDSTVAGREVIENDRWGVAPSLSFAAGNKSFFTLSFLHLGQDNVTDYGIPFVPVTSNALRDYRDRPAPVARDTFYGFKDRDNEILKSNLFTVAFSHTFDDNMSLRNQFRVGHSTRDSIATPPRLNSVNSTEVTRELRAWDTIDEAVDNQTDFTARFKMFGMEHALVTGAEFIREKNVRYTRAGDVALTRDFYNPNPFDTYSGRFVGNPLSGDIVATTQSAYLIDTIKLHPKFEVNGSVRYDRYNAEGILAPAVTLSLNPRTVTLGTTRTAIKNTDDLVNYRFAAVYKPVEAGSIYASYGTAVNPSISGLIYENATVTTLDPEKTKTLEAGAKWGFYDSRLLLTSAVFRVEKTNARTPLLDGTSQILAGKQRVDGIELGITGNITRDWSILTGYTLLDSRYVKSNGFSVATIGGVRINETGKRLINTPRNSFNLWSTYQLPFKINLGGGARFVDTRFANTINTRFVDSYWLIEATASYQVTKNIEVRLNGYNLGNKYYFDRITGGQVVPGAGRSLLVSTGFRF